jgi:hypothetical protein
MVGCRFHPAAVNNDIPVQTPPTGFDALRTLAVSRRYRDNFAPITAGGAGCCRMAGARTASARCRPTHCR